MTETRERLEAAVAAWASRRLGVPVVVEPHPALDRPCAAHDLDVRERDAAWDLALAIQELRDYGRAFLDERLYLRL